MYNENILKSSVPKKSGTRYMGILIGSISLVAVLASLILFIVAPLSPQNAGSSLIEFFKQLFANVNAGSIIFGILWITMFVIAIASLISLSIKKISKNNKINGNVSFCLSIWALVTIRCLMADVYRLANGSSLGIDMMAYSVIGIAFLDFVYNVVCAIVNRNNFAKICKKMVSANVVSVISCVVALGVFVLLIIQQANPLQATIELFSSPFLTYVAGGVASLIGGVEVINCIIIILGTIFSYLIAILLATTLLSFIFNLIKFGFDKNYWRASKYFDKTSPLKNALGLVIVIALSALLSIVMTAISGGQIILSLPLIGVIVGLVVMIILSVIYHAIVSSDKFEEILLNPAALEKKEEVPLLVAPQIVEEEVVEPVVEETAEPIAEETIEPVVEEVSEPIVEEIAEPVVEVVNKEEEIVKPKEEVKEAPAPAQGVTVNVNQHPQSATQQPMAQPPYGYYPYPPMYPYPYPPMYAYPPVQQTQPQPMVICIPYGGQMPQQQVVSAPVQAPVTPAPAPAEPVVVKEVTPEPVDTNEVEEVIEQEPETLAFMLPKKTLEERLAELPSNMKRYYKHITNYASSKEGVKYNKSTFAETVYLGRDCIVKIQIKQAKIVCSFSLNNFEVKNMLKTGKTKEQMTVIKIVDTESLELAKQSVDMAYKFALEAKEERHQEQLRKRREARASKKA